MNNSLTITPLVNTLKNKMLVQLKAFGPIGYIWHQEAETTAVAAGYYFLRLCDDLTEIRYADPYRFRADAAEAALDYMYQLLGDIDKSVNPLGR